MSNSFSGLVRLGKDPESKDVNGTNLINLNLANNCGFGDKKSTNWINGQLWGDRWLRTMVYLKKGSMVWVEGELIFREYTDREGNKKISHDLRINSLDFADSKKSEEKSAPAPAPAPAAPQKKQANSETEEDMPF
jgi:single-strand DNA-binding protein